MFIVTLPVSEPVNRPLNHSDNQVVVMKLKIRRSEKFFGLLTMEPVQSSPIQSNPVKWISVQLRSRAKTSVLIKASGKGPAGKHERSDSHVFSTVFEHYAYIKHVDLRVLSFAFCICAQFFLLDEQNVALKVIRPERFTVKHNKSRQMQTRICFNCTARISETTTTANEPPALSAALMCVQAHLLTCCLSAT